MIPKEIRATPGPEGAPRLYPSLVSGELGKDQRHPYAHLKVTASVSGGGDTKAESGCSNEADESVNLKLFTRKEDAQLN